ncbi:MAG: electron transport complex subunit RsxC [Muribaculaceae bacterium]|nr:electron transport complex subunit RsxC [Muribaculaceae bacterium]
MRTKTFRIGGIHPPEHKDASLKIEWPELPRRVVLPLSQHIGAPARPTVAKGEHVERCGLVAECPSFVSASIHTPISGTVKTIEALPMAGGMPQPCIVIEASEEDHAADTEARKALREALDKGTAGDRAIAEKLTAEELRTAIRDAGIVGLGGAAFPSHVKYSLKPDALPEVLIINACECEPYLRCDDALMNAYPAHIISGVELLKKAIGAPRAVIGIEENKPAAIAALGAALEGHEGIEIAVLKTKYPQGGEKQLIEAVTGRRVASGALPISVGAVVANVATAFAVRQACVAHVPLTERVITLTGEGIPAEERRNMMVAIGMPLGELPGVPEGDVKVTGGGPMMGRTAVDLRGPVVKGTSGLTVLPPNPRPASGPCLRCAACVEACPMGLEPYLLSRYGMLRMWDEARTLDVADCLECGACSYTCPSGRPLLDYIRLAKQRSRK